MEISVVCRVRELGVFGVIVTARFSMELISTAAKGDKVFFALSRECDARWAGAARDTVVTNWSTTRTGSGLLVNELVGCKCWAREYYSIIKSPVRTVVP